MRTTSLSTFPGRRFRVLRPGNMPGEQVISRVIPSSSMTEPSLIEFLDELTGRRVNMTLVELAHACVSGRMCPVDEHGPVQSEDGENMEVLVRSLTADQCQRLSIQVAYCLGVARACPHLSIKSPLFALEVGRIAARRRERAASLIQEALSDTGTTGTVSIEPEAPSPATVYRWYLTFRKAGNDPAVFAKAMTVHRHRKPRKPEATQLLRAFLDAKLSRAEKTPISELSKQFNELVKTIDPFAIDEMIEKFRQESILAAQHNAAVKKKPGMRTKAKQAKARAKALSNSNSAAQPPGI